MKPIAHAAPPKLLKYLLAALIALLVLIPLWMLFVAKVIQPYSFILSEEQSMNNAWVWPAVKWGVVLPVAAVTLALGARWTMASKNAPVKQHAQVRTQQAPVIDQAKREYVLEVIGLGVTLDKYRPGQAVGGAAGGADRIRRSANRTSESMSGAQKIKAGSGAGAAATR